MGYTEDSQLPALSDEDFMASRATLWPFTVLILRGGPNFEPPGPDPTVGVARIIWQHGKRNAMLRMAGLMPIVCPIGDGGDIKGIAVLNARVEEPDKIMAANPAVLAVVLAYEVHESRSFAGSALPAVEKI
jgi:hypothetical protein